MRKNFPSVTIYMYEDVWANMNHQHAGMLPYFSAISRVFVLPKEAQTDLKQGFLFQNNFKDLDLSNSLKDLDLSYKTDLNLRVGFVIGNTV